MMVFDGIGIASNIEDAMLAMHLFNENEPDFKLKSVSDRYGVGTVLSRSQYLRIRYLMSARGLVWSAPSLRERQTTPSR